MFVKHVNRICSNVCGKNVTFKAALLFYCCDA